MTGAGDEMENISRSIERARENTKDMEARAAAMDELEETGAFESALSEGDEIDRELEEMTREGQVEAELETLKAEAGDKEAAASDPADVEPADPEIEAELEELKEEEEEAAETATEESTPDDEQ